MAGDIKQWKYIPQYYERQDNGDISQGICVCVCMNERETERERDREKAQREGKLMCISRLKKIIFKLIDSKQMIIFQEKNLG